jgi:pilus assembly protein CpaE
MTDQQSKNKPRVHLSGACEGLEKVREALGNHADVDLVGYAEDVRDAAGALAGGHLDVVVHATRASTLPSEELSTIREYTRAPVILVTPGAAQGVIDEAIETGDVDDVLPLPMLTEQIVFAIRKAAHAGRRSATNGKRRGRVLTVFSPKGGTGKSVTATNLAAALAKYERKRTLLVDLDLQFGDAAIMLGLEPEKTIYDLVVAPGELDSEKLASYIAKHPSGLDVLPAPLRPEDAELVTEAKIGPLLEVVRGSYDAIVIDTSPFFHGPMLATLDRTDDLLLVCTLDVPTVKNVRLSLQTLDLLSFPAERVNVVLNRASSNVGMKRKEVEGALDFTIRFEMPNDPAVPLGVNRGNPVVLVDGGTEYTKASRAMARGLLTQGHAPKGERRKWLPSLVKS